MPVVQRWNGTTVVYVNEPWPAACRLEPRKSEDMTQEEIRAELRLLMTDRAEDLHRACCVNPSCPAKR